MYYDDMVHTSDVTKIASISQTIKAFANDDPKLCEASPLIQNRVGKIQHNSRFRLLIQLNLSVGRRLSQL